MRVMLLCAVLFGGFMSCEQVSQTKWTVQSPDEQIRMIVELSRSKAEADNAADSLTYSVILNEFTVVARSPLGLERDDTSFLTGFQFTGKTERVIDEQYTLHNGKRRQCRNHANEMTLSFINRDSARLDLKVRAYNDGVAFKYVFPDSDSNPKTILQEATGFHIPDGKAVIMPCDDPGQWWPAYENFYETYDVGSTSPTESGWAFPALFKVNNGEHFLLLTESGLNGSYCGTHLQPEATDGMYRVRLPEASDAEGMADPQPTSTLPWETSWKVIIVGSEPADIVESSLVTHVADPPAYDVGDYVEPGIAAWSWWSDSDSPRDFEKQKKFVDMAKTMNWDYYLVDANWNYEPVSDLKDFIKYADSQGIGVLIWYNSGGPNNVVTEAPRDRLYERERRRQEFRWLQELGVRGIKVDFWHSDKQEIIQYYIDLFKDAHDFGLMVNCHGCTIPRGWHRTYPNLLTLESVSGAECYKFDDTYPDKAPWHNVNLVFTRNVIGPMDFTPVTFTDVTYPHKTTHAHELALSVVFQSGIQHFADRVSGYLELPEEAQTFLSNVPVTWDDTRCIAGSPSEFVVLARQKQDEWYVAGINGLSEKQQVEINLLDFGDQLDILFIGDGETPDSFKIESLAGAEKTKTVTMQPYGGFVLRAIPIKL